MSYVIDHVESRDGKGFAVHDGDPFVPVTTVLYVRRSWVERQAWWIRGRMARDLGDVRVPTWAATCGSTSSTGSSAMTAPGQSPTRGLFDTTKAALSEEQERALAYKRAQHIVRELNQGGARTERIRAELAQQRRGRQ